MLSYQQALNDLRAYSVEIQHLRALNAELVAALDEIANHNDLMSDWPHTIKAMQRHARAALAKAKERA